jgi:hypothetical protein
MLRHFLALALLASSCGTPEEVVDETADVYDGSDGKADGAGADGVTRFVALGDTGMTRECAHRGQRGDAAFFQAHQPMSRAAVGEARPQTWMHAQTDTATPGWTLHLLTPERGAVGTAVATARGGFTVCEGAEVKPTWVNSLTSAGRASPQACICWAMASSVMCTTNSRLAKMLAAVSLSRPSLSRLRLNIKMGGSSPTMLNMENGAALATPLTPIEVTKAIGRGTIRLAISL